MKTKILVMFLALLITGIGLVSCENKNPSEIKLPNKDLSLKDDGTLYFKDKPFTGKVTMNPKEKTNGFEGFLNFKEGNLALLNEVKNTDQKAHYKFTLANGEFDGDATLTDPINHIDMQVNYTKGVINKLKYKGKAEDNTNEEFDLSFNNGLASGVMIFDGHEIQFRDGITSSDDGSEHMRISLNRKTGEVNLETLVDDEYQETPNLFQDLNPKELQKNLLKQIFK